MLFFPFFRSFLNLVTKDATCEAFALNINKKEIKKQCLIERDTYTHMGVMESLIASTVCVNGRRDLDVGRNNAIKIKIKINLLSSAVDCKIAISNDYRS